MRYNSLFLATLMIFSSLPCFATTIIWDGKTLASDSQGTLGHHKNLKCRKMARSETRQASIACSGNAFLADLIMDYFLTTDEPLSHMKLPPLEKDEDLVYALVIYDNGVTLFYGGDLTTISSIQPPFAMGTGGDIALGAVLAGKTAVQAVMIARDNDIYTGGKIQSLVAPQNSTNPLTPTNKKSIDSHLPN